MKWPGHVECTGEMRSAHEVSAGKQEGENVLDLDIRIMQFLYRPGQALVVQ